MPEITRFGPGNAADNTGAGGVTWFDIDIADDADREWLMAWQEIDEQTRQALLEPVRFNHYEQVPDGTLLSIKTLRPGQMEDVTDLADLKLLIGSTRAVTVRTGALVPVDQLRQRLLTDRTLVTAVDLLGFLVSAMTNRMEAVIYVLTQDIDDVEDALLDGNSVVDVSLVSLPAQGSAPVETVVSEEPEIQAAVPDKVEVKPEPVKPQALPCRY